MPKNPNNNERGDNTEIIFDPVTGGLFERVSHTPEPENTGAPDGGDAGIYGSVESKEYVEALIEKALRESETPPEAETGEEAEAGEKSFFKTEVFDWIQCVVFAVLVIITVNFFLLRQISVVGGSMFTTLHDADRIIVTPLVTNPKHGDIVIIESDRFDTPIVKRVIATAGQTLAYDRELHCVILDGVPIDEPYINGEMRDDAWGDFLSEYPGIAVGKTVTVDAGKIFVMGDNRNASTDSRVSYVGQIDTRLVIGKVLFVLLPGADESGQRDFSRIGIAR
ncbi:MAG: signal peptidase I [Oscillospiraceae bacterium]|nr:signal peptidase I [Oscillospiraceae bacterium]